MKNLIFEKKQVISKELIQNIEEKKRDYLNKGEELKSIILFKNSENERKNWTENKDFFPMIKISCPPQKKKKNKVESEDEDGIENEEGLKRNKIKKYNDKLEESIEEAKQDSIYESKEKEKKKRNKRRYYKTN